MKIKNVVFDIGNVLVKWAPHQAINAVFPECDAVELYKKMFPVWLDLNLGKITEVDAVELYHSQLGLAKLQLNQLMEEFKTSQELIPGSIELLQELSKLDIPLYSITDNTREIIEYHYKCSSFLSYFKDIVVSANIGVLKPNPEIYNYLLLKNGLNPAESVFIDDTQKNVEGALKVGMQAFQFTDDVSCRQKLIDLRFGIRQ